MSADVPEASEVVTERLSAEGVRLHLGVRATKVDGSRQRLTLSDGSELEYDALLVAAGRKVNVDGLGLEAAGVEFSRTGVEVDDHLRTSNRAIYAAGDACLPEKFTHAAVATAKLAVANALDGAGAIYSWSAAIGVGHPALHVYRSGSGPGRAHSASRGAAGDRR